GDRGVTVWDVRTGKEIWSREENGLNVDPCIFSPDSSLVLLTSRDGPQICNLRTGEAVGPPFRSGPGGAAFLPDGKRILTWEITGVDARTAKTWDLGTRQLLNTFVAKPARGVHITPAGKIGVSSGSRITLWDAETGREERVIAQLDRDPIEYAVFSPDGRLLLWSGRFAAPLQVTDVEIGKVVGVVPWKEYYTVGWAV